MNINTKSVGSSPDGARDNSYGDKRSAPIKDAWCRLTPPTRAEQLKKHGCVNTDGFAEALALPGMGDHVSEGTINLKGKPCDENGKEINPNKPKKGALQKLRELLGDNVVLLPIPHRTKRPVKTGWQKITVRDTRDAEYGNELEQCVKDGGNIGVLLGEASGSLCAIDADSTEGAQALLALNPWLNETLISQGKRGCQFWVIIKGEYHRPGPLIWTDRTVTDDNGKEKPEDFGEWRADGNQSVIFGVHPEGNTYRLHKERKPVEVLYGDIRWPINVRFKAEAQKAKEPSSKPDAREEDTFAKWARKFNGDLRTLGVKKLLALFGITVTTEDSEKITFRCPCEVTHTNQSGDRDCALYFPGTGDRRYVGGGCFHHSCGLDSVTALLDWFEAQKPGCIDACCGEKFANKRKGKGERGHWAPIEGETAKALLTEVGGIKCVGANWYINNGGVWKPTKRDQYREAAIRLLPDSWKTEAHGMCVIRRIEGESQIHEDQLCGAAKFDEDGDGSVLIAVQNGVLRLPKGGEPELLSPNPAHGFTAALKVDWNKDAACPTFTRVLKESLPDGQDRELLLDVLATSLIPASWWEAALVLQGEAGTGKSTVMAPITAIYGSACPSLSLADLCHPSGYKLAQLRNKLINLATELNTLEMDDTGLFKQLVSGEQFTAREIYGHPFGMCSTATLVFLANSLPRFKHGTDAEARRLRFVKFSNRVARPDVKLKDKVAMEAEGVFTLLVQRACSLLNGRKLADQGKYGQEVAKRFQVSNDPMGQFVVQCCKLGAKEWCRKDDLVVAFEVFRETNAIPIGFDSNVFFRTLYDRFQGVRQQQRQAGGVRERVVVGISIVEPDGKPEEAETKSAAHEPEVYEPGSELPYEEAPPRQEVKPEAPKRQTKADRAWARKVQRDEAEYARQMARKEPECPF